MFTKELADDRIMVMPTTKIIITKPFILISQLTKQYGTLCYNNHYTNINYNRFVPTLLIFRYLLEFSDTSYAILESGDIHTDIGIWFINLCLIIKIKQNGLRVENDITILATTRSNTFRDLGFMNQPELLNVAQQTTHEIDYSWRCF